MKKNKYIQLFEAWNTKDPVELLAKQEEEDGYTAEVYLGYFDGRRFDAEITDKTWKDGVPVVNTFSDGSAELEGQYKLVDSSRGWWYIQGPDEWYAVKKSDYGTPPFEY